jgi:hypothetical protein
MKGGITSFTANTAGKVGAFRAAGGINGDGVYTPDLKVQCDIKREFLNSDRVQGLIKDKLGNQIPPQYVNQVLDWAQDDQGNIPVDFRLTGPASKVPGLDCVDMTRATHNVLKHLGDELKKAAGTALQQGAQDLGNKIKGLFGH